MRNLGVGIRNKWVRTNCSLRLLHLRKLDDTTALRAGAIIQDLRQLNLTSRLK